jgi:hypothetical protein
VLAEVHDRELHGDRIERGERGQAWPDQAHDQHDEQRVGGVQRGHRRHRVVIEQLLQRAVGLVDTVERADAHHALQDPRPHGQPRRRCGEGEEDEHGGERRRQQRDRALHEQRPVAEPDGEEHPERHRKVQGVQEDQRVIVPAQVAVEEPLLHARRRRAADADPAVRIELRPVEGVRVDVVRERPAPLVDEDAERERREVADERTAAPEHEGGDQRHEEEAQLVRMSARRGEPQHRQGRDDGEDRPPGWSPRSHGAQL